MLQHPSCSKEVKTELRIKRAPQYVCMLVHACRRTSVPARRFCAAGRAALELRTAAQADVRCLRLLQDGRAAYQVDAVELRTWNGGGWKVPQDCAAVMHEIWYSLWQKLR